MANARKITSVILGTAIICALAVLAGPNPAAQAAEKPIVIGASISLNGAYARTGEYQRRGYEMWVESVNARGGLHGRKIELKYYDDKSDPNEAAKLYERLITVDKVDLLLGPYSSPVTKAAAPIAEKYKIPMVSTGAADQAIFRQGFKYIFQTYTPENFYMDGVLEMAAKAGYKTMAAVNEDTVFAKGTAEGGIAKGKQLGIEVVFREAYAKGVKDVSGIILKAKAKNPDIFLGGSYLPDSTLLVRQAKELDFNPRVYVFSVGPGLPDFGKNLAKDSDYVFGPSQWEPTLKLPGAQEFADRYKKKYGDEAAYHAAGGYGAGQILEAGIRKAGSADREKVREALAALDTMTIFGAYKVDAGGLQVKKVMYMTQWLNGKREVVWPESVATAKPVMKAPAWKERK
ncbi:MAG: amino acid ABC transporter substrate-binding protein [Nitrospirota bacterium]